MSTAMRAPERVRSPELQHVTAPGNARCGQVSAGPAFCPAVLRYPSAVGRAQANFANMGIDLSKGARKLQDTIMVLVDCEGLGWAQIVGDLGLRLGIDTKRRGSDGACIAAKRVQVHARELRGHGLLSWRVVPPGGCYPGRDKEGRIVWNGGHETATGGRVWEFPWAKFGVAFDLKRQRVIAVEVARPPALPTPSRKMPPAPSQPWTAEQLAETQASLDKAIGSRWRRPGTSLADRIV